MFEHANPASMFHLPLKTTERVDLQRSLHRFVEESYSLEQADEHRDAFAEVHTLRERCRTATLGGPLYLPGCATQRHPTRPSHGMAENVEAALQSARVRCTWRKRTCGARALRASSSADSLPQSLERLT